MGILDGRVCVITGAGRGIGRAHALLFAREGARVVVNDVAGPAGQAADPGSAQSVVDEIVAAGGEAVASVESVADTGGGRRIIATAVETFGDLHVVVNNAGVLRGWSLESMTDDDFDVVVAVNLKGTFNLTRWAAAYWREQTGGTPRVDRAIVNTSSGAGLHGNPGQLNYAASKAGVAAMTVVSALELEALGVRVNCVVPVARTPMAQATPGASDFLDRPVFDPEHVAPLAVALAAPDSPFTGQLFSVVGTTIGLYSGWSIADEVTGAGPWSPADLRQAMDGLPRSVPVNSQRTAIMAALR